MNDISSAAAATPPPPNIGGEPLFTALPSALAHDLRSPLLTLSLELVD